MLSETHYFSILIHTSIYPNAQAKNLEIILASSFFLTSYIQSISDLMQESINNEICLQI